MRNPKYKFNPYPILVLIIIPLIFSVVAVIMGEYIGAICLFIIGGACLIWFISYRKLFFSKIIIDESGIKIFYRKKIIKQLNWNDINDAQAYAPARYSAGGIMFTDTEFYTGKDEWKNIEFISINFNSELSNVLYKYKDKIPVSIKNLDVLPPDVAYGWNRR